jgi:hypothetical protein
MRTDVCPTDSFYRLRLNLPSVSFASQKGRIRDFEAKMIFRNTSTLNTSTGGVSEGPVTSLHMSDTRACAVDTQSQTSEAPGTSGRRRRTQDPEGLSDEFLLYDDMADAWIQHNWKRVVWVARNIPRVRDYGGFPWKQSGWANRLTDTRIG